MAETLTVSSLARGALRGAAARGGCGWLAGVRGEGGRVALVSGALAAADAACDAPSAKELDALLPAGVEVVGTYRAVGAGEDGTRRQTRGRKEKWKMARRVAQAAACARCARLARVEGLCMGHMGWNAERQRRPACSACAWGACKSWHAGPVARGWALSGAEAGRVGAPSVRNERSLAVPCHSPVARTRRRVVCWWPLTHFTR